MGNRYLEKIAGLPGSFQAAAMRDSIEGLKNRAKSHVSGLTAGTNVSRTLPAAKPRVIQNRTGMSKSVLSNSIDPAK